MKTHGNERIAAAVAFIVVGALAGCGTSEPAKKGDTNNASGGPSSHPPIDTTAEECVGAPIDPGASPVRRLTRAEYNNTVHDLLGDSTQPGDSFPQEEIALEFTNNADAQAVSSLLIEHYETAAIDLAKAATLDLPKLLACNPATQGEDACMASFVPRFGQKAYRRPLNANETSRLISFYKDNKALYGFRDAARLTMQAILQSPNFLYRVEASTGDAGSITKLSPYEMATRLSYLFTGSMPDTPLFDAAASGALDTNEGVVGQAQRLFDDPRSRPTMKSFFGQWLDFDKIDKIEKDAVAYPKFTPAVRVLLRQEADLLVNDVMFAGGGLQTLLRGAYTYLNKDLAAYYGVAGPQGAAFERVELDPARAAGFFTQAGFGAANAKFAETAPVQRGVFVRQRLLCDPPTPPPPNIPPLPPPDPKLTTRERLAQHRAAAACAGCHNNLDPLGFGFEHYDAIGLWRDSESGRPVDATGNVAGTMDIDGRFDGAVELSTKLAGSSQVQGCTTLQAFRFGYGRAEGDVDGCTLVKLKTAFGDGNFKELVLALTQTDAFLFHKNQGASP